jgi:uncharacterized surface protein with fasciclin (FAS1) repeats
MYITSTKSKSVLATVFVSAALLFSSVAMAKKGEPGKPGAPGAYNIVEIASMVNAMSGEFSTLLTAATCEAFNGAVVGILTGSDKVTLFAPTDAAFSALGLTPDNVCATPDLLTILGYHVTEGRRFDNSLFNQEGNWKEVDMLFGGSVTTYIADDPAMATIEDNNGGKSTVASANINASNGVIHVINAVLIP